MFDPDQPGPILRLGEAKPRKADAPASLEDALSRVTLAQHLADQANLRWIEALMDYQTLRAQTQPVPASKAAAQPVKAMHRLFDGFKRPTASTDGQALARHAQADPLWTLHMGEHDKRVHQVATGPRPILYRADGTYEVLGTSDALDAPL